MSLSRVMGEKSGHGGARRAPWYSGAVDSTFDSSPMRTVQLTLVDPLASADLARVPVELAIATNGVDPDFDPFEDDASSTLRVELPTVIPGTNFDVTAAILSFLSWADVASGPLNVSRAMRAPLERVFAHTRDPLSQVLWHDHTSMGSYTFQSGALVPVPHMLGRRILRDAGLNDVNMVSAISLSMHLPFRVDRGNLYYNEELVIVCGAHNDRFATVRTTLGTCRHGTTSIFVVHQRLASRSAATNESTARCKGIGLERFIYRFVPKRKTSPGPSLPRG